MIHENDKFSLIGVYASAEEAMVAMVKYPPDIAIVDIRLKNISGIDFILQTKSKIPQTQFLICSAYQNSEIVFDALKAGASGYIVKGDSSVEIQNAVIELHNGGAPMSSYIAKKVISSLHKTQEPNDFSLSDRELEVLALLSKGLAYKDISEKLFISVYTVKNHCQNIYKRMHVQNKIEAVNKYRNNH
jgi:DNA-binding NarL/FixJ family response regulator